MATQTQIPEVPRPLPTGTLAGKLIAAMNAVGAVTKRGFNEKQKYGFVKATDVANEVRSALIAAGVAFTYDIEHEERWEKATQSGGMLFFVSLTVRGDFIDRETGETLSGRAVGWGADSLDKAPYKAMTGALKYLLRMNFLIPDEEDPENSNEHYDPKDDLRPVQSVAARQEQPREPLSHNTAANVAKTPAGHPARYAKSYVPRPGEKVTTKQVGLIWGRAKGAGKTSAQVMAIIGKYGYEKVEEVWQDKLDAILAEIEHVPNGITNEDSEPF